MRVGEGVHFTRTEGSDVVATPCPVLAMNVGDGRIHFHPKSISSTDIFIQTRFHPMTLSSKHDFIQ